MENKLDRIMIGSLENKENLEEKGKVCFNLYVEIGEYSVFQRKFINSYGITGKLSSGEKIWGQHIGCRKRPDKQEFLKEVKDKNKAYSLWSKEEARLLSKNEEFLSLWRLFASS